MSSASPFTRGFRALRDTPSVLLAELGWRWMFGAVSIALIGWAGFVFLREAEVTKQHDALLHSMNARLIAYAINDILAQHWKMLAKLLVVVGAGLSVLWVVTSSMARSGMTRVLLDENGAPRRDPRSSLWTVIALQSARVGLVWIGVAAYVFCAYVASFFAVPDDPMRTLLFLLLFLGMLSVVAIGLSYVNWILFLAPIFAVRDGGSAGQAVRRALRFSSEASGALVGLNFAHFGIRAVWLVVVTVASLLLFVLFSFSANIAMAGAVLLSLLYCAVADGMFVARYAGYVAIAADAAGPHVGLTPSSG